MTFQKLRDELQVMYGGCHYFIDVDKILDAELFIDGKVTNVAKIAVKENFTAEQTAALFVAIHYGFYSSDRELVNDIQDGNYRFDPDITDEKELGVQLMEDYVEMGAVSRDFYDQVLIFNVNYEKLGWEYTVNQDCVVDRYGFFEKF